MRALLALLALLGAAGAAAVPFTSCAAGQAADLAVDASPWPPVQGQDLTVTVRGSVAAKIAGGSARLTARFDGIPLIEQIGELSVIDPTSGSVALSLTNTIPRTAPAGTYEIAVEAVDQNEQELLCVQFSAQVSGRHEPVEEQFPGEIRRVLSDSFTSCGSSSDVFVVDRIEHTTPRKGETFMFKAIGRLTRNVNGGSCHSVTKFSGWVVEDKKDTLAACADKSDKRLPWTASDNWDISFSQSVDSSLPSGSWQNTATLTDSDGTQIMCIDAKFTL